MEPTYKLHETAISPYFVRIPQSLTPKTLYEFTIHIHRDITLKFPKASAILHHPILVSPQGTLGLPFASKAAKHAAAPVELPEVVLFCQASNCSIEMLDVPAQKFQEVISHLYLVGDSLYG